MFSRRRCNSLSVSWLAASSCAEYSFMRPAACSISERDDRARPTSCSSADFTPESVSRASEYICPRGCRSSAKRSDILCSAARRISCDRPDSCSTRRSMLPSSDDCKSSFHCACASAISDSNRCRHSDAALFGRGHRLPRMLRGLLLCSRRFDGVQLETCLRHAAGRFERRLALRRGAPEPCRPDRARSSRAC